MPAKQLRELANIEVTVDAGPLTEVLNAIYEVDFLGFSYGFRPGRQAHRALDALAIGIRFKKIGWILDADVRGYLVPSSYYTSFNDDPLKSVG